MERNFEDAGWSSASGWPHRSRQPQSRRVLRNRASPTADFIDEWNGAGRLLECGRQGRSLTHDRYHAPGCARGSPPSTYDPYCAESESRVMITDWRGTSIAGSSACDRDRARSLRHRRQDQSLYGCVTSPSSTALTASAASDMLSHRRRQARSSMSASSARRVHRQSAN